MPRLELFLDNVFSKQRWVIHAVFWTAVLTWYVLFFGRQNSNYLQTFFFVGLLMPVTIGTSYFLNYFLVPRYLITERYGLFVLYLVYTLIGAIFLEMLISVLTLIMVAEFNIRNMSPASIDLFFLLTSLLSVVFLALAIKLLLHWRSSREDYNRLMLEKMEGELRFLKTQLNPHFLFNTLNNLYYLTLEKSDLAPKAVLQLSEMLDYVLHSVEDKFVSIDQEWHQLNNYIELESLRYQDRLSVEARLTGNVQGHVIPPMLLITLMENAFKHGVASAKGTSWIKVEVECMADQISVLLRNYVGQQKATAKGIGLKNLRAQLDLLYHDNYELITNDTNSQEFLVTLMLKRNESPVPRSR